MKNKMFKSIVIGFFVLALHSCSGTSSNTTNQNQSFSLSKFKSTTIGSVYKSKLTGSDSNGVNYTGSIAIANRTQTLLNGILVTPQDSIISVTGGGKSLTVTGTSNIDINGNLISVVIQTTGLTCTPISPDMIPTSIKIGDFGILSTMVCNDNTTQERNWRVQDAGNSTINLISNETIKNQFNTIISVSEASYIIDGNGNMLSFKAFSTQSSNNFTITYQSI